MKRTLPIASALSVAAALLLMVSVGRSEDAAPPAKPTGTAVVSGKVTDSTGKVAASIKVSLFSAADKPQHAANGPGNKPKGPKPVALATTTTDAEGAYKFDALPAGSYTVTAMGGRALGRGSKQITLTDAQKATADIQLALGGPNGGNKKPKAN